MRWLKSAPAWSRTGSPSSSFRPTCRKSIPILTASRTLKDDKFKEIFASAETGGKARIVSCVIGWACEEVNAAQVIGYDLEDHGARRQSGRRRRGECRPLRRL